MMYIVRKGTVFVTVEPTLNPELNDFSVTFAWTESKCEAVRFGSRWHAKAVARALRGGGTVIGVRS